MIEVPGFEERKINGSNVVFYKIVINTRGGKSWTLEKRYSEFDELDKSLKETYAGIPSLPGKTLFKLSEAKAIEDRRKAINNYLKVSTLALISAVPRQ